jgi:arylsulfatase A-like enzyme
VLPTILELAGLEPLPTPQVGSLVPLATGAAQAQTGPILSEIQRTDDIGIRGESDPQMHGDQRYRLLREGSLKLVETSTGAAFLYDLAADPGEQHELSAAQPAELARMARDLEVARASLGLPKLDAAAGADGAAPALDEATKERLKALGYTE